MGFEPGETANLTFEIYEFGLLRVVVFMEIIKSIQPLTYTVIP